MYLLIGWSKTRDLVSRGAIDALCYIVGDLGFGIKRKLEVNASGFLSWVDFLLYVTDAEGKKVPVEIKAPDVFNKLVTFLSQAEHNPAKLELRSGRPTGESVVHKVNPVFTVIP